MKNLTKIFAAVLMLCLLVGTIALTVSAAAPAMTPGENKVLDFENYVKGAILATPDSDKEDLSQLVNIRDTIDQSTTGYSSTPITAKIKENPETGNKYLCVFDEKYGGTTNSALFRVNIWGNNTIDVAGYGSVILEFDMGSDYYLSKAPASVHGNASTLTDDKSESGFPAIAPAYGSSNFLLATYINITDGGDDRKFYTYKLAGDQQLVNGDNGNIILSKEANRLDHFKYVLTATSDGKTVVDAYINGEFSKRQSMTGTTLRNFFFYMYGNQGAFSIAIDNISVTYKNADETFYDFEGLSNGNLSSTVDGDLLFVPSTVTETGTYASTPTTAAVAKVNGNKYLRFYDSNFGGTINGTYFRMNLWGASTESDKWLDLAKYNTVVIEYDFGSDKYLTGAPVENGNTAPTFSDTDTGYPAIAPAYTVGNSAKNVFHTAINVEGAPNDLTFYIIYDSETGRFKEKDSGIVLSNKANELDHFTYILTAPKDGNGGVMATLLVNGEYAHTKTVTTNTNTKIKNLCYRFYGNRGGFSLAFDNIKVTTYEDFAYNQSLNVSGNAANRYNSFQAASTGFSKSGSDYMIYDGVETELVTTSELNTYLKVTAKADASGHNRLSWFFDKQNNDDNNYANRKAPIKKDGYVGVFDFDISFNYENETALKNINKLCFMDNVTNTSDASGARTFEIRFMQVDGEVYVYGYIRNASYGNMDLLEERALKLSNKTGVFDHITHVIRYDSTVGNLVSELYLNGELLCRADRGIAEGGFNQTHLDMADAAYLRNGTEIYLDNLAVNFYEASEYDTAEKLYDSDYVQPGYVGVEANGAEKTNAKELKAALQTGVQMNMSLNTDMAINLYVPKRDDVTFGGFYATKDVAIEDTVLDVTKSRNATVADYNASYTHTTKIIGGVEYYVYSIVKGANDWSCDTFYAKFTTGSVDTDVKFILDQADYMTKIVKAYACGSVESRLMIAISEYKNAICGGFEGTKNTAVESLLSTHTSCKCDNSDVNITDDTVDYSNLKFGVTYTLSAKPTFDITVNGLTGGETVTVKVNAQSVYGGTRDLILKETEGNTFKFEFDTAADIKNVCTITIDINGTVTTGTFSLAEYHKVVSPDYEGYEAITEAIWKYSDAAYKYKMAKTNK